LEARNCPGRFILIYTLVSLAGMKIFEQKDILKKLGSASFRVVRLLTISPDLRAFSK